MASEVGKNGALQILVFEIQGSPLSRCPTVRKIVAQGIGVVREAAGRELIERRIWIGKSFLGGRNDPGVFPDPDRGRRRRPRGSAGTRRNGHHERREDYSAIR